MDYKAQILVTLKDGVKDSKAQVLEQVITRKEYAVSPKCSVGQYFRLAFEAENEFGARERLEKIAHEILSNPVIEQYEILSFERV